MKMPIRKDFDLLKAAPLTPVLISGADMLCLLGSLQLALRHPKNVGPSAQVTRVFAEELEKRIVEASPGLKDLCAAGWDPRHDVP